MVPPLLNGIVGAVAYAAFCAVCLNSTYHELDHGIFFCLFVGFFLIRRHTEFGSFACSKMALNIRKTRSD